MPRRKLENKTIEVILLDNDKHLGEKYEVVRVAPVFARNILLPAGKAVIANKLNLHNYLSKMESAETARKQKASDVNDLLMKIQQDGGLKITGKVNEKGTLYAKVDESVIAGTINDVYSIKVESHWFKMKKKIVEAGDYLVAFEYRDAAANIAVKVIGEMDEAAKKKMEALKAEEDAKAAAKEEATEAPATDKTAA